MFTDPLQTFNDLEHSANGTPTKKKTRLATFGISSRARREQKGNLTNPLLAMRGPSAGKEASDVTVGHDKDATIRPSISAMSFISESGGVEGYACRVP